MTAADWHTCTRLLSMIARKLGHDWLLLTRYGLNEEKCVGAVFGHYSSYDTFLLKANGKIMSVKSIDAAGNLRSYENMYAELTRLLYKILEDGGNVSDGMSEVDASAVPEFMVECDLNDICHLE